MDIDDIIQISSLQGWDCEVSPGSNDILYLDFFKDTPSGKSFSFSGEMADWSITHFLDDILTFVDGFNADSFATELYKSRKDIDEDEYLLISSDMASMINQIWLLAYAIADTLPKGHPAFPRL